MKYDELLVEKKEKILTIKFNRPEQLNAANLQLVEELTRALIEADQDEEIRVVIISGVGRAFCAGIDIREALNSMKTDRPMLSSFEEVIPKEMSASWTPLIIRDLSKPVVAAINGSAIGAGFTIALACDMRIASDKAQMGAVFTPVGLIPEFGSTYNLPRLVGIAKACELVFTGNIIDAKEAREIGLVNHVVPADQLEDFTHKMAAQIAQWPSFAVKIAKRGLYQGLDSTLNGQLQFEALGLGVCAKSEDFKEALTAFLEKRKPVFRDR